MGRSRRQAVNNFEVGRAVLPVMKPQIASFSSARPYLKKMDERRIYANFGPLTAELEERYASLLGVNRSQVVSCTNATLGLAGCLAISEAKTAVLPGWSFAATGHAPRLAGLDLKFVDISNLTWRINLCGEVVDDSSVVVDVLPFGARFSAREFPRNMKGVVDAAASLGNVPDLAELPESWDVVFSLHATKILGCGEGALVVLGNDEKASRFRSWTNFGFYGSREAQFAAVNAKMSEISAAYALAALDNIDAEIASWKRLRERITNVTKALSIDLTPLADDSVSPYWNIVLSSQINLGWAERFFGSFGIETRAWWPALLPDMPAFAGNSGALENSREFAGRTLGLPFFRDISEGDIERVHVALGEMLEEEGEVLKL